MSEHTNERTETHACDSISRQKAINTVKKMRAVCDTDSIEDYEALLETAFEVLPSAQPNFSCDGCKTPKHICGICMRNYPNITDHYCTGEWAERREE